MRHGSGRVLQGRFPPPGPPGGRASDTRLGCCRCLPIASRTKPTRRNVRNGLPHRRQWLQSTVGCASLGFLGAEHVGGVAVVVGVTIALTVAARKYPGRWITLVSRVLA